jgi:alanyl-tRNA synthetase
LVTPDRLRFDFSHPKGLRPEELAEVAQAANADVLTDAAVEVIETSKAEAEALGALAFFEDKYGDRVRVVRAGAHSTEFCGGTHVDALGMIGPITVVSEGSIGSNVRRIFAVTGASSLALLDDSRRRLDDVARLLKVEPAGVLDALQKVLDRQRQADKELQRMQGARLQEDAARLAQLAVDGVVVHRQDGATPEQLRDLAQAIARHGARVVVVAGSPDGSKVGVAVVSGDDSVDAGVTVKELAQLVGGGGGGSAEVAVAGGSDPSKIDTLLAEARRRLGA